MKLTIKTALLQEMVSKAAKGASRNKMIPITSLLAIEAKKGVLTLTTTDATNTLKIINKVDANEDFYVVLPVELFSKLVAKTTTDNIILTLQENNLEMKGNGTYAIDLPLDENGKLITFPQYVFDNTVPSLVIDKQVVNSVLTSNKAALATTLEIPCLTGYYCTNDKVISTDTFKVCSNRVSAFSTPLLIPAELMNLLAIVDEETITVQQQENKILFTTNKAVIYGSELDNIEEYPIDAIEAYLQTEFKSVCKVKRQNLLDVLDRLSLFISAYDKNALHLTFTPQELVINSKRSNGTEAIKYIETTQVAPFTCTINIELFRSQVVAQDTDVVEIWFGHDKAIKMVSNNITQIAALLEDDVLEG